MSTLAHFNKHYALRHEKRDWLRADRGVLKRLAVSLDPKVSGAVVSRVFNGWERSARVEAALAELGAPGFNGSMAE